MNHDPVLRHLRRTNEVAVRAASMGRHPFGALLVAPDGETVLAEQGNIDTLNHAESTLARAHPHADGSGSGAHPAATGPLAPRSAATGAARQPRSRLQPGPGGTGSAPHACMSKPLRSMPAASSCRLGWLRWCSPSRWHWARQP
ncbi:hypothetical protein [Hydrogenophaga sp.]|uniref:hypothetical protein n=1 Tax=Hydrogenophaga sp. TaxID=1904254 RepID=UPI00271E4B4E|nr:hypothetical protein [Hydrogenophaga sp.]MDO9606233.1 hypothetical protein [Hydrogenophaga sp.]